MAAPYGPLRHHTAGVLDGVVVDPRFGVDEIPTQPVGWGGSGSGTDTSEIWVDTDYTGATDASADINAAIVAADLNTTLGFAATVRLRPGVLRLEASIGIRRRTRLIGSGMKNTILRPIGNVTAILKESGYSQTMTDVTIADLEIDGALQTVGSSATPKGIFFTGVSRITFRNLHVHDCWATGVGVDHITGLMENIWAVKNGRKIWGGSASTSPGCSGIGIGVGMLSGSDDWEPLTVIGCHTEGNGNYGIFLEVQDFAQTARGISIIGCTARNNGRAGIGDVGSTGTVITGCTVSGNREGIALDNGTIGSQATGVRTIVANNTITDNDYGIRILSGSVYPIDGPMIRGNIIDGSDLVGILVEVKDAGVNKDLWIGENYITGSGGAGISVIGTVSVDRLAVTDNRITGAVGAAISVTTPTTNVRIWDNEAWANGSGIFFDIADTHTNHRIDSTWVEGTDTLPA